MALPALVLVHGGSLAGDCWDLTIDEVRRMAPELVVLAVDLPGRRAKSGDLLSASIRGWVDSVVADVDAAELNDIVIVGHSMAGLTVPGVVTNLGASRVREMILAAACVPTEGTAMVDVVGRHTALMARRNGRKGDPYEWPPLLPNLLVLNGVRRRRRRFMAGRMYPESSRIPLEKVSRRCMPDEVPRTWIFTIRDRTHPPREQLASVAAIGGVQTLIPIDTCHGLMVSEPERLAEILVERCRLYAT
jgi:pimeloyl-ACP methyl ester carboxylesterase